MELYPSLPWRSADDLTRSFGEGGAFEVQPAPDLPTRTVDSCQTLLALPLSAKTTVVPSSEVELQPFWSTAVDCEAAQLVQRVRPARKSLLAELLSARDPSGMLPPELGLLGFFDDAAQVRQASRDCRSWKQLDPSLHVKRRSDGRFDLKAEAWNGELLFYARGDLDADGYEDLLVRRNGHADGGSYGTSTLFLLTRTAADSCIRASMQLGRP